VVEVEVEVFQMEGEIVGGWIWDCMRRVVAG
jgi:hypothetical protein